MRVTGVRITKRFDGDGPLKCFASVTFDQALTVKGFKLLELDGKLEIFTPSEPDKKGQRDAETNKLKYWDTTYFNTKQSAGAELRQATKDALIKVYSGGEPDKSPEPDAFADDGDDIPF